MIRTITNTVDVYCETLDKLRHVIQTKRRWKLSCNVILHHDNARLHTASKTNDKIPGGRLKLFDHPPYSPNLEPSDYFLFLNLK